MVVIVVRSFLASPNPTLPRSVYMRFLLGIWILGTVFMIAHFQTTFIAVLTKPEMSNEINSLEDLLKSTLIRSTGDM